jgi:hypothetical protein
MATARFRLSRASVHVGRRDRRQELVCSEIFVAADEATAAAARQAKSFESGVRRPQSRGRAGLRADDGGASAS